MTAHLVGRLPNGCIFESTEGKGGDPMAMVLSKGAVIPGMDLAMQDRGKIWGRYDRYGDGKSRKFIR